MVTVEDIPMHYPRVWDGNAAWLLLTARTLTVVFILCTEKLRYEAVTLIGQRRGSALELICSILCL